MTNERVDLLRLAADDCEAEANTQLRDAPNLGPTKEQRNRMDAANIMKRVAALRAWADELESSRVEPTRDLQPIATAPKDGTPILGYSDSDFFEGRKTRFVVVHYAGEMQGWTMPGVGGLSVTHWTPLPQWVEYRGSTMSNLTQVNRPAEPK